MKFNHPAKILLPGIIIMVLQSCSFTTDDPKPGINKASWITDREPVVTVDSLLYQDHPAPVFMKKFRIPGRVKSAELHITAAGYYESWINGGRCGEQRLDPAWTDFRDRVYYSRIDVSHSVKKGLNFWKVYTGNGFYNPLPMKMWGNLNLRKHLPIGKPQFIAALCVTLESGKKIWLYTDGSWSYTPGPVIRNNVYLGEWYDANREPDIEKSRINSAAWKPATITEGPGGRLTEAFFPPIMITQWIKPVSIQPTNANKVIVDFGQNFAGIVKIKISAKAGDTIRLRYGERIYPDGSLNPMTAACGQIKRAGVGGPGSPALAQQEDLYISAGKDNEYFEPKFTFHGFRYLEVSGLSYLPKLDEILGARMNSAVPSAGSTYSSEPYLNQLDEICGWTFLSNLFSVQSDCPAREKFGYGGDINATAEAFIYKYDMSRIYRKAVYDWVDAMDSTRFVDTAPFIGLGYCGISWESAFLNLQYWLWLHYQDSELIRELYEQDKAWMNKVAKIHPDGLVNDGLSDHESLSPVPVELTGSCHYLQAARIMEQFAILMDKVEDASAYHKLAATLRDKIAERFWYQWQKGSKYNEQTRLACLLDFEVLDEPDRFIALKELVSTLEKDDFHVKTGIFGTKALLNSLSKLGRADIAYKVVTQKGFPGWRHMIDQGATTLWETWKESDNVFSQNHPMFGSVSEWYNKWIGGIMPDESKPGSGHFLIHPQIIGSLDSVASNREINGKNIGSKWIRKADEFHFYFDIPEGQGVDWIIPEDKNSVNQLTSESGNPVKVNDQRVSLSPGKHHFIVKLQ